MLGPWAGLGAQADLIGKNNVDLSLSGRRRTTTLSERMRWMGTVKWTLFHCTGVYQRTLTGAQNHYQGESVAAGRCGWRRAKRVLFPAEWVHNQSKISWSTSPNVYLDAGLNVVNATVSEWNDSI
jgi:hypothetical protein